MRGLSVLIAVLLAALCWQVGVAWAGDSIVLAPPASQPVAGQVTRVPIGVSVDSSFPGGSVQVKTKVSGVCAQSPALDSGTAARFEAGINSLPYQGPWTRPEVATALVVLHDGRNLMCAWLLDKAGNVVASNSAVAIALPATRSLLRGWDRQTVACRSLTRSEAAQVLDEPGSTLFVKGEPWPRGVTAFERQHSAFCYWQYTRNSNRYFGVILTPEQAPATLAHAVQLSVLDASLSTAPGSCLRVRGIGSAACVYTGTGEVGTLVAVEPHLILQVIFHLAFPHRSTDTVARIHAQEELLAQKVLARVPLAHR
jgi:hypothetical protein